ncbi:hypothetical protein [Microbispora sp. ATCC PTA-5024]|uniref:hypothetical protein n=1 Tax=Microbispora sp. ATCC PTA-5024 TaxID=316330 RepID=UPI0012EE0084|nr:hypothetical protein [Microbispora sp. ATCC PTA-5024]
MASNCSIISLAVATHKINTKLGKLQGCPEHGLKILSAHVSLYVDADTASRANEYERRTFDKASLQLELERLQRFRSTILTDPGNAMAYWMLKYPERLGEDALGQLEGLLNRVAKYNPTATWVEVGQIIQGFLDKADPEALRDLAWVLRWSLHRYGQHQDALRIADLFRLDIEVNE